MHKQLGIWVTIFALWVGMGAAADIDFATELKTRMEAAKKTGEWQVGINNEKAAIDEIFKTITLEAEQGNARSQYDLGLWYEVGRAVSQDFGEAAKWYLKSANQGEIPAQVNLGILYSKGLGVLHDNKRAHMWFNVAGANGNKIGADNRAIIEKRMTSAQISKAQKLAREWIEKHR